jgi:hypothetical protein
LGDKLPELQSWVSNTVCTVPPLHGLNTIITVTPPSSLLPPLFLTGPTPYVVFPKTTIFEAPTLLGRERVVPLRV